MIVVVSESEKLQCSNIALKSGRAPMQDNSLASLHIIDTTVRAVSTVGSLRAGSVNLTDVRHDGPLA